MSTKTDLQKRYRAEGRCSCGNPREFLSANCKGCQASKKKHADKRRVETLKKRVLFSKVGNPGKPSALAPDYIFHRHSKPSYK